MIKIKKTPLYKQPAFIVGTVLTAIVLIVFGGSLILGEVCGWYGSCVSKLDYLIGSTPNEIGDTLAGFAGSLAFIWIVVTVWLQATELQEQRLEFEAMNSTMSEQLFESTFFSLIGTFDEIVNSMDLQKRHNSESVATGRDCFKVFYNDLSIYYKSPLPTDESIDLAEAYERFWKQHQSDLAHYFRFLHNAFRAISESRSKKPHHGRLLRAMLSDYELAIIFYNCMDKRGVGFRTYAHEFQIFDNLPKEFLLSQCHEKNLDSYSSEEAKSELAS